MKRMETKVKAAGLAAYLGSAGLLGVLYGVSDAGLIAGLPDPIEVFIAPALPMLITLAAGWKAKHTPQPGSAKVAGQE